ncbi:MAG: bifunctional diaminohydroxyphosphoribosylaminopyrimidine deaminase/5-amino-6-(5-phosphoribosylamino)uracil reductase RibD [Candidatus Thermoplasmatota archaeon]|nr:bifunctional diaminohydroxyphosphoribosylaminopyrimidine deaminase/5-amino-6-(5-phosphoribosylamino)uracil reductase RibD [Candidatus Thermoplasmatota archaeon]
MDPFMRRALNLAKNGYTSPNPMVGAILVRSGEIIGEGYHRRAGMPHAEVEAIEDAKKKDNKVEGSTLYVTLEPCCHYGRTPPCTDAIIKERIGKVVVGVRDPNPEVNGKGIEKLRDAGMEVVEKNYMECGRINEVYFKYMEEHIPFVLLKMAITLNGCYKTKERYISSQEALRYAHELRKRYDAVAVGANTLREDDPQLNIRFVEPEGREPYKIVFVRDTSTLPEEFKLIHDEKFIAVCQKNPRGLKAVEAKDLREALKKLAGMGITSIMLEGGQAIAQSAFDSGIIDKCLFIVSPGFSDGRQLKLKLKQKMNLKRVFKLGNDIAIECSPE